MSFLDYAGLSRFYDKIKGLYALKTSIPTTLPANGGNADTVDNKHASDFLQLSNGCVPCFTVARQDTGSEGGQINFQRADGRNVDYIDFLSGEYNFRMVYDSGTTGTVSFPRPGSNICVSVAYLNGVSPASNGYMRIHNGITIEWGHYNGNEGTITFPVSFGTLFAVVACNQGNAEGGVQIYSKSASGFSYKSYYSNLSGIDWIAIGV